ncbi:MAG: peptide ABC transporter substrate-binding protein [Actinomycetota bacterium]|nr:peptide ABC transporter substrate-binding protein [Actinomycetota bacterium]
MSRIEEISAVKRHTWLRLLAVLFAFTLVAAACGDDDDDGESTDDTTEEDGGEDEGEEGDESDEGAEDEGGEEGAAGVDGGELIWIHEQEPPDLHLNDPNNNLSITSWLVQGMWESLWGVAGDTTFFPELLADEPEVTDNGDDTYTIDMVLRDGLTWSDGEPLTAEDVEFTFNVVMETDDAGEFVYLIGDRTGWDQITDFTVNSDTEFSVTFDGFYSGYKALWSGSMSVMPSHAFGEGAGAAEVNEALREWQGADGTLPSSGPLLFGEWERGVSMTFNRNDSYHGSVSPDVENTGVAHVDTVVVSFATDTDTEIQALKAGEAHVIFSQPQTDFGAELATDEMFTVASLAGPVYEHWGFNLLNPHLAKPEVREAIAYALDKEQVVTALYEPLFGDLLPTAGLGNTYWMSNQPDYEDHQTEYAGANVDAAREALEAAGYVDEGGVYTHPEDGALSLRVGTTGGNALRELQQELIQAQLGEAGIEITIDNVPGGAYFSERPFSEQAVAAATTQGAEGDPTIWDITQFAWVGGPWPGGNTAAYRTGSGNNPYAYANPAFDELATECDATVDEAERAACYNEADTLVTQLTDDGQGLVVVPLTQKPSFYAYNNELLAGAAVSPDANDAGPLVNVVDYQFAE